MTVLRVCYQRGVRFDESYYLKNHVPLTGRAMAPYGVAKVEIMRVTGDGGAVPYQLIFSAYFDGPEKLAAAMQSAQWQQVLADVPNYFGGAPDVLVGELVEVPE